MGIIDQLILTGSENAIRLNQGITSLDKATITNFVG